VGRQRAIVWGGLVAVTGLAWLYLLSLARGMSAPGSGGRMVDLPGMGPVLTAWTTTDVLFTLSMWVAMMVGMMLPAAAPMIMLFAAVNRRRRTELGVAVPTGIFVLGYLSRHGPPGRSADDPGRPHRAWPRLEAGRSVERPARRSRWRRFSYGSTRSASARSAATSSMASQHAPQVFPGNPAR
jgi:hypothetical protein